MLWAGQPGIRMLLGVRDFSVLQNVQTGSGAHPASCSLGTGVLSWGLKWLGHYINHRPPSSANLKNEWSYTSSPFMCLNCMDSENFYIFLHLVTVICVDNYYNKY